MRFLSHLSTTLLVSVAVVLLALSVVAYGPVTFADQPINPDINKAVCQDCARLTGCSGHCFPCWDELKGDQDCGCCCDTSNFPYSNCGCILDIIGCG